MENKQKNPRRRLNSLILLVTFTAIMLIVSTYAWFSAQKTVTIGGLEGTVNVAEGLEISLDAKYWSQEVDFSSFADQNTLKKLYAVSASGVTSYKDGTVLTTAPEHNIIPSELLPVSTTGITNDGIGQTDMNMYRGLNTDSIKLDTIIKTLQNTTSNSAYTSNVVAPADHDYPGYYAIDLFLRNSSKTTGQDILQLNSSSQLKLKNASGNSTGLQNTVRVAFAVYNATEDTLGVDETLEDLDKSVDVLANQQQILNATTGTATIKDVAIWEPNANDHVQYIVDNNNNVNWLAADQNAYGIPTTTDANNGIYADKFGLSSFIPTYALSSTSVEKTYDDIYNWDTAWTTTVDGEEVTWASKYAGLTNQVTLKTEKNGATDFTVKGGVKNLVSVTASAALYKRGDETGVTNFKIDKAKVSRIRMYVWLEGQDVDCINYASHGGGIYLDVGLLKDGELESAT